MTVVEETILKCKEFHAVARVSDTESEGEFWLQCVASGLKSSVKAKMIVNDWEFDFHIDTVQSWILLIENLSRKVKEKSYKTQDVEQVNSQLTWAGIINVKNQEKNTVRVTSSLCLMNLNVFWEYRQFKN